MRARDQSCLSDHSCLHIIDILGRERDSAGLFHPLTPPLLPQALRPSSHVYCTSGASGLPQLPYQAPPAAQHVATPALVVTHLGHAAVEKCVGASSDGSDAWQCRNERGSEKTAHAFTSHWLPTRMLTSHWLPAQMLKLIG